MHPLEVILQLQLSSDQTAVLSLPSIVSSISPSHFESSSHLQKWISRISSLLRSKHPGARWAGLCLALQTSILSKDLMVESAKNWIAISLPMLSRTETPPALKACIRLLDYIFCSVVGIPEIQRQLAIPNVLKFSAALISFMEKNDDREIRHLSITTLTHLVPLYPTHHRALQPSLSTLSLRLLSGSSTTFTPSETIEDACALHSVLHLTGGKAGSALIWRNSLDTSIVNAWSAFSALRTTFPQLPRLTLQVQPTLDAGSTDPVLVVPLSLDRLKCSIALINKLLTAVTLRPVPIPIGQIVKIALCLLRCTPEEAGQSHFDVTRRALELSVVSGIWKLACELVSQLAKSIRHHLNPHLPRIVSCVTHHLEQSLPKSHRIPFLRLLPLLLTCTHPLHSPTPPTRLVKSLLPLLNTLLSSKSDVQQQLQDVSATTSKRGKIRAGGYEGDEVFKVGRGVLCSTREDGNIIEATLDSLDPLLSNPHLSDTVRTLAARLLVTLLLELPRHPPSAISSDLALQGRIHAKTFSLCNKHILTMASGWINSAVGLVVNAVDGIMDGSETVINSAVETQHRLDVLLHPRVPPLLRSLPPIEAVSLFRTASAKEDRAVRDMLGMGTIEDIQAEGRRTTTTTTTTTTTGGVTTIAYVSSDLSGAPAQPESLRVVPPTPAPAPAPALASTATSVVVPVATRQIPQPSFLSTPTSVPSMAPVPAQQIAPVAPISRGISGATNYQDSDEESEEMPEIDMRSDSD